MKLLLCIWLMIGFVPLMAQNKSFPVMHGAFLHPSLDSIIHTHHLVAFVDEYAYLSRRVDEKSSAVFDSLMNHAEGIFSKELFKIWQANPDEFKVIFQDPDSTCAILNKNGISSVNLPYTGRQTLAALLGVDAVVTVRCIIFKKYEPSEATAINIASIAATFGFAYAGGFYPIFDFQPGTDVLYAATTIHNGNGELIYLDKGDGNTAINLRPGGKKSRNNLQRFPYLK